MNKSLLLLSVLVLSSSIVFASLDREVLPFQGLMLDSNNDVLFNTTASYDLVFSLSSSCTSPLLNDSSSLTSNSRGIVSRNINVSSLNVIPQYLCEYFNGTLRTVHYLYNGTFKYKTNLSDITDLGFNTTTQLNAKYLGITATATNSNQLGGIASARFLTDSGFGAENLTSGTVPSARLSGSYNINITGNSSDVNCVDCIGAGQISDIYVLNTGDTINGDLLINGNLTVFGGVFNATVTNQFLNGSFLPSISSTFDIGSVLLPWSKIYVTDWSNVTITTNQIQNIAAYNNQSFVIDCGDDVLTNLTMFSNGNVAYNCTVDNATGSGGSGTVTSVNISKESSAAINITPSAITTSGTFTMQFPDATVLQSGIMTSSQATSLGLKALGGSCTGSNSTHINVTMNATTAGVECVAVQYNQTGGNGTGNASINANTNAVVKWNGTALVNSSITDNGSNVTLLDGKSVVIQTNTASFPLLTLERSFGTGIIFKAAGGTPTVSNIITSDATTNLQGYVLSTAQNFTKGDMILYGNQNIVGGLQVNSSINAQAKGIARNTVDINGTLGVYDGITPSLFVTNNGKVGIGNSAPNSTLDISGNLSVTGNTRLFNNFTQYSAPGANGFAYFGVQTITFNGSGIKTVYTNQNGQTYNIGQYQTINVLSIGNATTVTANAASINIVANGSIGIQQPSPRAQFEVNGTSLLIGLSGINTTAPTSLLDVNGNASFSQNVATYQGLFSNGTQVCTASNGLCAGSSDNTTWNQVLANGLYLGINNTANNSYLLDGNLSTYYSIKAQTDTLAGNISTVNTTTNVRVDTLNATSIAQYTNISAIAQFNGTGNASSTNGTIGYPAVWASSTSLIASLIQQNMLSAASVNASTLNTSNVGTDGQLLTKNSTGGMGWVTASGGGNVTGTGINSTSGHHVYQTSSVNLQTSNLTETPDKLNYPRSLYLGNGGFDRMFGFNESTNAGINYIAGTNRVGISGGGNTFEFANFTEMYYPTSTNNFWEFESFRSANFTYRLFNQGAGEAWVYAENKLGINDTPDGNDLELTVGGSTNITKNLYVSNNTGGFSVVTVDNNKTNITVSGNFIINSVVIDPLNINYFRPIITEFCGQITTVTGFNQDGFISSLVGTAGVMNSQAGNKSHPCILTIRDSTTVDSGTKITLGGSASSATIGINGTENFTAIIKIAPVTTATKVGQGITRIGFHDSTTSAEPTDGCWAFFNNTYENNLMARCANNGLNENSSNNFTFLNNTWYIVNGYINPTSNNFTVKIYNESGSLLWNNSVGGTRIPTLVGRETEFGIISFQNTTDAATDILAIDYLTLSISRPLRNIQFTQ